MITLQESVVYLGPFSALSSDFLEINLFYLGEGMGKEGGWEEEPKVHTEVDLQSICKSILSGVFFSEWFSPWCRASAWARVCRCRDVLRSLALSAGPAKFVFNGFFFFIFFENERRDGDMIFIIIIIIFYYL